MAIREIGVRTIIENLGGFLSGMDRYNTAIEKAEKRTQKFADRAGKAGRSLGAIAAPLLALGFLGARTAISFETAFIGVEKTVDATTEQFAELETAIRRMSQEIPVSVEEFSALAETAGQLGIEIGDIENFIRVVADLGVATNLSSEQAAISLARLVTITGLSQSEFDRLGSTIVDLGNNLAATEEEILTFGLRIASAGKIAGLTEADILSIGAAMSAVGIQAQAGGTAVQKVLLDMTEAVATTSGELQIFAETAGLSAQEFADLFERDAGKAFTRFVEGLGTAGDDAFIILRKLGLEDQRLLRSFLSLAAAGDLLSESMTLGANAFEENTALTEEAEKRYASAASKLSVFLNKLNELFITVGNQLLPVLSKLVDVLAPIISTFATLAGRFPIVTIAVVGLGVVLGGLAIVLIGLGFILPGVIAGLGLLTAVIGFLSGSLVILNISLGPIGLIILGISAAIIAGIIVWRRYEAGVRRVVEILRLVLQLLNPITAALTLLETFTGIDVPGIRGFAHGGTAVTAGPAIVGERGPEMVHLPAGAQVTPISRSTSFNVTANYTNPQEPQGIRLDLEAAAMMTRA